MTDQRRKAADGWREIPLRMLPFADAGSTEFPLPRLLRLSLFQVAVGLSVVLLTGTLNRVMIVELGVSAWLVALMVALPLVFAPFRALIGHKSDGHRSALGWRRVPYIWFGTLMQFGGLAIMPFALLILSGDTRAPVELGQVAAAGAFLLVGAGLHTTQTAGLALATDLAPEEARPRVVALLYVMLLVGMVAASIGLGLLLSDFSDMKFIRVIQGCAVITIVMNMVALWKQEALHSAPKDDGAAIPFREAWAELMAGGRAGRLLLGVGLGTAGFAMQDILLEPYGGEILGLTVGATTLLTALLAGGSLIGFAAAAQRLGAGADPYRLAGMGAVIGIGAFAAILFSAPLNSPLIFRIGIVLIGLGGGLFSVCTLTAAMDLAKGARNGLALGAWGAVNATAAGCAIAAGGAMRDMVGALAARNALGPALTGPEVGYGAVYTIEIVLLFATLIAIGPLVRPADAPSAPRREKFGLAELPGQA